MPPADPDTVASAAVVSLRAGGVVALPTETVYGLAADARDPHAVARIYAIKGRPADHPLILHVADSSAADSWVRAVPRYARRLMTRAWPGPLTLVLPRAQTVGDWVTGGQDTVAIRVPDHPLTLRILNDFGGAVAAPSANRFGHVSPTTAAHVVADLTGLLDPDRDMIVDGGSCPIGVESTIVDCTGAAPVVLRPGRYSGDEITELGGVTVAPARGRKPRVSGTLTSHYAPTARVHVVTAVPQDSTGAGLIAAADVPTPPGMVRIMAPADTRDYAQRLYWALRESDALALSDVFVIAPSDSSGLSGAVRDRVQRAAAMTDERGDPR